MTKKWPFNTQFVNPLHYFAISTIFSIDFNDLVTDGDEIYQQLIAEYKGWA